ncbi:hypermethylated in cancer 2 protein [Syngnathus scovelli]|uniref:hypermethylated in cancer 2 protein n=1 Tax=Syngnathus scovelli TaxID=161590 RepID=UPI0021105528|nr:hypermethylated in cancer 2 protein [Syngnathus scovelli]XP_049618651.1 hypermethylated in cancer 2 protein [Syngnathus scovelli]
MELPNHAKQLLLQLNQQRAKGFLCDVIIVVENALFRAHKNILAASSIYFKSLVLHDNLINLDTEMVNPSVFRQVLDFIYTGKLLSSSEQGSEQNFSALLTAASYLQLHDLAALCRKKLKRSGGKALPGKPSAPGPLSRLRLNSQRLSSSAPAAAAGPNNHYQPSPSDAELPLPDEGLRDKLSDDEMYIGSSGGRSAAAAAGNGGSNGNLSSGGSAGEPDLGLDLTKKSPPSAGTALTDALSPHSNSQESPQSASVSTTNSASLDDSSTTLHNADVCSSDAAATAAELNCASKGDNGQHEGPPPQKKYRQGGRKNEWPKKEASGLKSDDHDRPLVNGVIVGPKDGRPAGGGGFASDQSLRCKDDEEGGENGQDHSEESAQSDGESAGGGPGGAHQNANYVYRQEGFEPAFGDNLYVCIPCGKGFPSSEQLNAHVETHTEDELYVKEEAGALVKEEDEEEAEDLSAPVGPSRFGSEARPFKCTVCNKSYKDPATLRQHEKSHWLTRPFPCNICGKMFTQRGTMTRHMRSHLGLKPFACEECGMRFTRQYRLTEHMRVHSGEKPYECQLCGGKFTQQRNLISHLRMHTSPS